jgi:Tfp pilus assembly protein FimT
MVVMAITGIVAAASVPWLITYWRAATTKAAAEELAAGLNSARQLAIAKAQSVCVEVSGGKYRFRTGGCSGTIWTGTGTGANGFFALANQATLTANANPVFDYLGAATPAATFTITSAQGGTSLKVVVSGSGRVRICPAAGCAS